MSGKHKTRNLLLLIGGLVLLWWLGGLFSPAAKQRSFRSSLFDLDTNLIRSFIITPAPVKQLPPFLFRRSGGTWRIHWVNDSADADPAPIHDMLRSFSHMRVVRYVGQVDDIGGHYALNDSLADHVRIQLAEREVELLVGRVTDTQPPLTIVRLPGDESVYAIDGPLGRYADQTFGDWLPKYLVTGDPANWTRLTFNFPTHVGYVMERRNGLWTIDGTELDPERTERYLGALANAKGPSAVDPSDTLDAVPMYRLMVDDTTRDQPVIVVVFSSKGRFIVRSTLNPTTVMPFDEQNEVMRMFRPPGAFMPRQEADVP